MASANADTNSLRNSERAAWSSFMAPSFQVVCCAAACRSACDRCAEPITDAAEHQNIDREHGPPQQRPLLLERLALLRARRSIARAKATLDEGDERAVGERRQHEPDHRPEQSGKREVEHA